MRRLRAKKLQPEIHCPACDGTGFPPVPQPEQPGRKIYPAPCTQCHGKGRIPLLPVQYANEHSHEQETHEQGLPLL
jgi:DnaJ-class molecular chaperone